jgi:hypothetical protein
VDRGLGLGEHGETVIQRRDIGYLSDDEGRCMDRVIGPKAVFPHEVRGKSTGLAQLDSQPRNRFQEFPPGSQTVLEKPAGSPSHSPVVPGRPPLVAVLLLPSEVEQDVAKLRFKETVEDKGAFGLRCSLEEGDTGRVIFLGRQQRLYDDRRV